ncbi:MAG: 50S ribosomal protein L25 [Candidatus Omnitrophota bacterium]
MANINLEAVLRRETGKGAAKLARREHMVPGVVYKGGETGLIVQVGQKELLKAIHTEAGMNAIINLKISNGETEDERTVIVKETQIDPLTDKVIHVDFHEISLSEKITVNIPIVIKGEALGVTEDSGVFTQGLWEMEIECLPTEIPEKVEVNVESLRIGDVIHVKDLPSLPGVTVLEDEDHVVASVHVPEAEETEEAPEEGEVEPELIKKGKEESEEEEEDAEKE